MREKKRKIAIFTGNRAEYGLLSPIIQAIAKHPKLDCRLLVSGAHLDENFGYTKTEIEKDGFTVSAEIKLSMGDDTLFGTAHAIATGILSLIKVLRKIKPDILVVYADRFEGFSAMIAGTQMNIPTAHIEGGDLTQGGALDDSVRHAMTKLAHLHFTTNKQASERIAKMGEELWRIHTVGMSTIDMIKEGNYAGVEDIRKNFGITKQSPVIIFTQHSVTTEVEKVRKQIIPGLKAMRYFAENGCRIVLTYPNNDAGSRDIITEIEKLRNHKNIQIHKNLGRYFYHGFLNLCGKEGIGACVGNSSSGIKESPAFGCPAVNIGTRQNGRLRADNVVDVDYDTQEIISAVKKALYDKAFRRKCGTCENPYGQGNTGPAVADILAGIEINKKLLQKKMTY